MKVYIKPDTNYYYPTRYVLKIIGNNQDFSFDFVDKAEYANLLWDHTNEKSRPIHVPFYELLNDRKTKLSHTDCFCSDAAIRKENGQKDIIATLFYMINCLQEYEPNEKDLDQYGRFKFESSYQKRFNSIEENTVQQEINLFFDELGINITNKQSSFFISHDIDTIYDSIVQDGFWAIKRMRIDVILVLLANEFIRNPHWRNIDRILKINNEYDVRSTFFWLVNKGRGTNGIKNADYKLKREHRLVNLINNSGSFNGLHKSCSEMSFNEELQNGKLETNYNRFHFLNFSIPQDWKKISDSDILLDCSLGFAERYGFRNSYGKSFQPFDLENNRPFNFIETPLHLMDTTFHRYMKLPAEKIGDIIVDFYEQNKYNCHLSLLWHNNSLTDYKYGVFLNEYKKIMGYLYENQVKIITPNEIISECKLEWDLA